MTRPTTAGRRLGDDDLRSWRAAMSGALLGPPDTGYERARRVVNARVDRRPAAIAFPRRPEEVALCLEKAGDLDLSVAVRGGGHNDAGWGTCEGGLLLDLGNFDGCRADPSGASVTVGGGARWGAVDRETLPHGMATPGGQSPDVGVGGLTLGGGWGTLSRRHGLTVDNLSAVEIVTPSGEHLYADADHEPDLFWALRGGGGAFGVVTSFVFRLHRIEPEVLGGALVHRPGDLTSAVTHFRDAMQTAGDALTADLVVQRAGPGDPGAPHPVAATFVRHLAPPGTPDDALAGLRAAPGLRTDGLGPTTYAALQSQFTASAPADQRQHWTAAFVPELTDDVVGIVDRLAATLPTCESQVVVIPWGGAITRVPSRAMAFDQRRPGWLIHAMANWEEPGADREAMAWADDGVRELFDAGLGTSFANFYPAAPADRGAAFFDEGKLAGLRRVKSRVDPENLLCHNQNVIVAETVEGGGR